MNKMQTGLMLLSLCGAGLWTAQHALAEDYPTKNIQMIVPYSAGGSIDIMARAVGKRLADMWGRNIIVDNRPGASGMIGAELVAKAQPDGYTLLGTTSSYTGTAAIRKKLDFNPATALIPVGMIGHAPQILVVHPSVPARTVREFVALAKKQPGALNYSSSGAGGNNHFAMALFAKAAGIKLTHIPYKGVAPAALAVVSGEVDAMIASAAAVMPHVKSGKVRAIAVTTAEPSPLIPGLPSIAQSGVPGYSYELWWAILAPGATPKGVLSTLHAAINKILATDDMKTFLKNQGAEPWPMSMAQLSTLLPEQIARYRKAAQEAGIPMQ